MKFRELDLIEQMNFHISGYIPLRLRLPTDFAVHPDGTIEDVRHRGYQKKLIDE